MEQKESAAEPTTDTLLTAWIEGYELGRQIAKQIYN